MSRKKILLVTTVCETFETILKGQPKYLGRSYSVYVACSGDGVYSFAREENISGAFDVYMERGISPFKDILSLFRLIKVIRKVRPDIVHSYTPKAGLLVALASYLFVPRRVHTFTGLIFPTSRGVKRLVLMLSDALVCFLNTDIVAEGEGVAKDLRCVMMGSKMPAIIGNGNIAGVDVDWFCRRKVLKEVGELSEFVFCYVGRITPEKGIRELLEAFLSLPGTPKLKIVGAVDETAPIPSALLKEIMDNPRIEYFGFLNDIRSVLASSSVLVLPSYREGFPNVVLQAGAMSLPVIATNVNGSNEIIREGYNGWLVEPAKTEGLRGAMLEALSSDRDALYKMGQNARKNVVNKYERGAYLGALVNFYGVF
ncbi:glycosyltransferase family 4 protein [Alcanivorax sp. ZXX171]|nr:glycosyltransferase family 4 protein [Alcanivorax sp. ZXX171]